MPQLGPLNWLFLFMLFWSSILVISCLVWWTRPQKFYFYNNEDMKKINHLWIW